MPGKVCKLWRAGCGLRAVDVGTLVGSATWVRIRPRSPHQTVSSTSVMTGQGSQRFDRAPVIQCFDSRARAKPSIRADSGSGPHRWWTPNTTCIWRTRQGIIYGADAEGQALFSIDTGETNDSYPALTGDGAPVVGDTAGVAAAERPSKTWKAKSQRACVQVSHSRAPA